MILIQKRKIFPNGMKTKYYLYFKLKYPKRMTGNSPNEIEKRKYLEKK